MGIRLPVTLSHRGEELPTHTALSKYIKIRSIYYMDCIISPFSFYLHKHTETHASSMHTEVLAPFSPALCVAHMHKNASGSIFSPHYLYLLLRRVYFKMCLRLFFSLFPCLPLCERRACRKRYINKRNVTSNCLGDPLLSISAASLRPCEERREVSERLEQLRMLPRTQIHCLKWQGLHF